MKSLKRSRFLFLSTGGGGKSNAWFASRSARSVAFPSRVSVMRDVASLVPATKEVLLSLSEGPAPSEAVVVLDDVAAAVGSVVLPRTC